MQRVIPDKKWWEIQSTTRSAQAQCPFANSYKCPRYYESLALLSKVNMISGMPKNKDEELSHFWGGTIFSSLCDEEVPSLRRKDYGSVASISNFCPEVSFKYFSYYADSMHKYADEIDHDSGIRNAVRDGLPNDWKYNWMAVHPVFYLDCEIFNNVKIFNEEQHGSYLNRLHPNIIQQISRMDNCLDANDPAGVLHAAANILETMAKDITNNTNNSKSSLGSFFKQFEQNSKLPKNLVEAVMDIYKIRNTLPTAGHGSLIKPDLTIHEAITVAAMTKAILEIEYRNKNLQINF